MICLNVFFGSPSPDKSNFDRYHYVTLTWYSKTGRKLTDTKNPYTEITDLDDYVEIEVNRAGTFHIYLTYENVDNNNQRQGSLYVQVEPKLKVGPATAPKALPLDAIRCQTVLAKCLGPLSTWEKKLLVAKNSGYNMIHFTPIQVRFVINIFKVALVLIENLGNFLVS